jgi:hypothetical protein
MAHQRSWAASISLDAMAIPVALEPGPLVTLVRCLTVAKVVVVTTAWSRMRNGFLGRVLLQLPSWRTFSPAELIRPDVRPMTVMA